MMKPNHRVALALVHRAGRWLVSRRPQDAHLGGFWEFPGGKCAEGEAFEAAALRELREECAVEAKVDAALEPVRCEYADRVVDLAPIVCHWTAGEGVALASDECRWVTLDELTALTMPAVNAQIIAQLAACSRSRSKGA